jgi:hypothetical protein
MSALHYTPDEMMAQWRLRAFPETILANCSVTRHDGIDLDAHLMARMRAWYVDLIYNAPSELLAPVDIADRIDVQMLPDGTAQFILPDDAVRLVRLLLPGWKAPAMIIADDTLPGAVLQLSGRQRSDNRAPVAVVSGKTVHVCSPTPGLSAVPLECLAVVDTPDLYHLDERALSTIKLLY